MLIEFRVENHRSLRDEQVLTFEAANIGDPADRRPRQVPGHDKKILPVAALYGANASGKSNVLSALEFMKSAVEDSHRLWIPGGGVSRSPFAWGISRSEPSLFEVTIIKENTKYQYGFVVSDAAVEEEWLFVWPNGRKQIWFEREGQGFKFGENFKGPNETIKELTRDNALFLSTGAQLNHPYLFSVSFSIAKSLRRLKPLSSVNSEWTSNRLLADFLTEKNYAEPFHELLRGSPTVTRIHKMLRASDLGIVDVKIDPTTSKIMLKHSNTNEDSWLNLEDESQGTKTLLQLSVPIFGILVMGDMLIIDELEASLHPSLALAIVQLFNDPKTNPHNAQLLFTTHDTNLLNSLGTDQEEPPLRRDQIWFTEKDKEGATKLYPLTDYKPRKAENLERGYLQGRYGAIPYLGSFSGLME